MKGRFGSRQRIAHALDAIEAIEQYLENQLLSDFLDNSMMRFACIKQLEIVGEACNHVDSITMNEFPDVEWRKIIGLRNLLIHEYFGIDVLLVWDIIQHDLPELKRQLSRILDVQ